MGWVEIIRDQIAAEIPDVLGAVFTHRIAGLTGNRNSMLRFLRFCIASVLPFDKTSSCKTILALADREIVGATVFKQEWADAESVAWHVGSGDAMATWAAAHAARCIQMEKNTWTAGAAGATAIWACGAIKSSGVSGPVFYYRLAGELIRTLEEHGSR